MRLTTKGRYAIRAMIDIALHRKTGAVSLANISRRQNISQSYLEQLFAKLRRKDLVKSVRGPGGGYVIKQDMNQIAMAQILEAIDEGSLNATNCSENGKNCHSGSECLTHDLWSGLTQVIFDHLNAITMQDVVSKIESHCAQKDAK